MLKAPLSAFVYCQKADCTTKVAFSTFFRLSSSKAYRCPTDAIFF